MKILFTSLVILYSVLVTGQDHVSNIKMRYRETWAIEYEIQIEIKPNAIGNYLVLKTVNYKTETISEIDWSFYNKILLEINKLEKTQPKQKLICTDGNVLSVSITNGDKTNYLQFNCIYPEVNTEALDLLNLIKEIR